MVRNTNRVLRQILPVLTERIVESLGSEEEERREVAGSTMGDLVSRLGDRVLPDLLDILEQGLRSENRGSTCQSARSHCALDTRQGVCFGMRELINSAGRGHVLMFLDHFLRNVRNAICDGQEDVREAAAECLDGLSRIAGPEVCAVRTLLFVSLIGCQR